MRKHIALMLLVLLPALARGQNQTYFQYKTDEARLVFFDKNLSRYIPHMVRMFQNGKALHGQIWTSDAVYVPEAPLLLLTDWDDDGNGGATPLPLLPDGLMPSVVRRRPPRSLIGAFPPFSQTKSLCPTLFFSVS